LVYLELLSQPRGTRLTQLGLSKALGVSLSTVNNALKPLRKMGAVTIRPRSLEVSDSERVLLHFGSCRDPAKDLRYQTRVEAGPMETERSMPSGVAFTAYSGYRLRFREAPADYGEVLVYADEKTLEEIRRRFPEKRGPPNVFAFLADKRLLARCTDSVVPDALLFADLWNQREWYAREFLNALKKRLAP